MSFTPAHAENGVADSEIIVGTVNVQSGPAADLGLELNAGAKAYIEKVNAAGGVNGRKIKWMLEDDGYEPNQAIEKAKKLIEKDKAFCLFNSVGTPTGVAVMPLLASADIPLIGMFTGGEKFRNPVVKNIFNIRGSYWDEAELMVTNIVDKKGLKKVAIFLQDDAFGQAVQGGVVKALEKRGLKRGLKPASQGKFQRNSENIDGGLTDALSGTPDAVVMVGTYKPLALFAKKARAKGFKGPLFTVSFVGTASFASELGGDAVNTYVTQVVPHPETSDSEVAKQYRAALAATGGKTSYGSFEGYLNAVTLVEAIKAAGKDLTRENLRKSLEKMHQDLGGFKVDFSPTNHQGSSKIYLTKIQSGKAVEISQID